MRLALRKYSPSALLPSHRPLVQRFGVWAVLMPLFFFALVTEAPAAEVEILTPLSGSTVLARQPEIHMILRLAPTVAPRQVRVRFDDDVVVYRLDEEMDGIHYLHFRLPLKPGGNRFTIQPGNQLLELNYQAITANIPAAAVAKAYLFHQAETLPADCSNCHDLAEVARDETLGLEQQESCGACHQGISEAKYRHDPVTSHLCLTCHQQSPQSRRIVFPAGKIERICFGCHIERKSWFDRKFVHGPIFVGGCTLCHDPHGSDQPDFLWTEGSLRLCLDCHSDKDNLVDPRSRLPFVHGVIPGKGCVICHDPHASDNVAILNQPINPLCIGCHSRIVEVAARSGHPVSGHPLAAPKELRRPNRKLSCVGCHDPHGSEYVYMLLADPRNGVLCTRCHSQ
jgi:predicted CXXCH cytochrome family protein